MSETYSLRELSKAVGVTAHMIRGWVKSGALPYATPRGPYTVYEERHYLRALKIKAMREDGMRLDAIAERLDAEEAEAEARARAQAQAQAQAQVQAQARAHAPAHDAPATAYRFGVGRPRHLCEVIELCPGVSLLIRADADTEAIRVARRVAAELGALD